MGSGSLAPLGRAAPAKAAVGAGLGRNWFSTLVLWGPFCQGRWLVPLRARTLLSIVACCGCSVDILEGRVRECGLQGGGGHGGAHRGQRCRARQWGYHLQAGASITHSPQLRHHLRVCPPLAGLPVHGHDAVALLQAGRLWAQGYEPGPHASCSHRAARGCLTAARPPGSTAAIRTGESPRSVRPKPSSPRLR